MRALLDALPGGPGPHGAVPQVLLRLLRHVQGRLAPRPRGGGLVGGCLYSSSTDMLLASLE